MILGLIQNATLLVTLCVIYRLAALRWDRDTFSGRLVFGAIFGGAALIAMLMTHELSTGIVFDGRSIMISLAGLFGGFVAAAVAVAVTIPYRLSLGGDGVFMGVGVIASSGLLGAIYHHLRRRCPDAVTPWRLYLFGVLVHVVMLAWTYTFPSDRRIMVLGEIALPVLLVFPPVTALIGWVLLDQERQRAADERLRLSDMQLRHQQRLESIGTLASGVAHEINNPVCGIMNYAQIIAEKPGVDPSVVEFAREIEHAGERVASIVHNLLTFARQDKQVHSPVRLVDIVEGTLSLVRAVLRHDQIVLEVNVSPDLPAVDCCSQQIQQVLMNLLTNARDALNERYPGFHEDKRIQILAGQVERAGRNWVRLTVTDRGFGIPPEIRERIFDPFFTTKPRDKGTGLGLAISHGIVKEHQGVLHMETVMGQGTQFHLDLPVGM